MSKKRNKLMPHADGYLFNLPMNGLRVFTVHGTWGRPDMEMFPLKTDDVADTNLEVAVPLEQFNYKSALSDEKEVANFVAWNRDYREC